MAEHETHEEDHGHSIAAWAAVATILVGAALASWAVWDRSVLLFVIGVGICIIGAAEGKILGMAGYGATKAPAPGDTTHTGSSTESD
jgi:hypothetical protein